MTHVVTSASLGILPAHVTFRLITRAELAGIWYFIISG